MDESRDWVKLTVIKSKYVTEINGCGLNNGGCQYICIPLPNNRSKCACPDRQEWDDTQRACTEGMLLYDLYQ